MLIFGCGLIGKNACRLLLAQGEKIEAFLDNAPILHGRTHCGIPIFPPSKYAGSNELVLITVVQNIDSVIDDLRRLNINNFAPYTDYIRRDGLTIGQIAEMEMHYKQIKRKTESVNSGIISGVSLGSVDLVISEGCTLRCRDCANLMQYYNHPKNADYDTTMKSFDRLYRLMDWIYEVRVIGGDAMINPRLPDYMRFLFDYEHIGDIIIYTNGIVIPNPKLLNVLTDRRVLVRITDYNHEKQRIAEVTEAFERADVPVLITASPKWQDCAKIYPRNRTPEQLRQVLSECCVRNTLSIKDGRLWRCPMAGNMAALKAVPSELNEFVDLLSNDDATLKGQYRALMQLPSLKVCDYCGGRPVHNDNPIPAAIQAKKPLAYEHYD